LVEVGRLAAVGELAVGVDLVAEHAVHAEEALLTRNEVLELQVQGAGEPGGIGPDAGQSDCLLHPQLP
jgi:hypothetical protein